MPPTLIRSRWPSTQWADQAPPHPPNIPALPEIPAVCIEPIETRPPVLTDNAITGESKTENNSTLQSKNAEDVEENKPNY